jgi:hypothetical protein
LERKGDALLLNERRKDDGENNEKEASERASTIVWSGFEFGALCWSSNSSDAVTVAECKEVYRNSPSDFTKWR